MYIKPMKREIAEELARIACVGRDNRFTRWVGRAGQSTSSPSGLGRRRDRRTAGNRHRNGSTSSSRQSVSSSSGDAILPLHLDVSPHLVRQSMQGRRSPSPGRFVISVHHQREVSTSALLRYFGNVSAYYEPRGRQWTWATEPRRIQSTETLEGDTRYFGNWIVMGTEADAMGKPQYVTIRSPTSNGIATVSIDYLKRRWNGFHEEDSKDMLQKELVKGKAFILADSKKKVDEVAYKKWKAQNDKAKEERKRKRSPSISTSVT